MTGLCHTRDGIDKFVSPCHIGAMDETAFTQVEVPEGPHRLRVEQDGYRVEVVAAYDAGDGRFVCDQLTIRRRQGGPPVTSEALREVAVAELVRLAIYEQVVKALPQAQTPVTLSERARAGGGPGDQDLRAVVNTYVFAHLAGRPPVKAVMERLGLPRSTANRWVALARERGLLGPATPRKAEG